MLRFQMLLAGKMAQGPPAVGVAVATEVAVGVREGMRVLVGVAVGVAVGGVPVTVGVGTTLRAMSIILDAWARVAVPSGRK
jgi:threonine/homoserine/homoserine lactone efflux protein